MTPPNDLWDSFWAVHASKNNVFHRLLWRIRFLFSSAYSQHITQKIGNSDPAKYLEIGCGSARTLHYLDLTNQSCECYAFDLSPQAIRLVRFLNPKFQSAIANAFSLPLKSNQMDVSFSIGLIEHFTREQAGQIVTEKIRVTKSGGVVAIMVPWQSSVYNLIIRKAFGPYWPFGEENAFHRRELALFMDQLGLTGIEIHVIYGTTLLGMGCKKG